MNPPDDMLDAIYLGDDPDTAALVVADWYDEHDQPERARLIRLCVRLAHMDVDDSARYEVADERDRVLLLHLESIYGRIPITYAASRFGWFRDLIDDRGQPLSIHVEDTFASEVDLGSQMTRWMDRIPVRQVFFGRHAESNRFRDPFFQQSPESMVGATLAGHCRLRGLQVSRSPDRDNMETLRWLIAHADAMSLEYLGLSIEDMQMLQHPALMHSPAVARLRKLLVSGLPAGPIDVSAWRNSVWATRLQRLFLTGGGGDARPEIALANLLDGDAFPSLREISVCGVNLSPTAGDWDSRVAPMLSLRKLWLLFTNGSASQMAGLGRHLNRSGLVELHIQDWADTDADSYGRLFAGLSHDSKLRVLRLQTGDLGIVESLLDWVGFPQLRQLSLSRVVIHDHDRDRLIDRIGSSEISALSLEDIHHFGETGDDWRMLGQRLRSGQLRELTIGDIGLLSVPGEAEFQGLIDLFQSPGVSQLRTLELCFRWSSTEQLMQLIEQINLPELRHLTLHLDASRTWDFHAMLRSLQSRRLWYFGFPRMPLPPVSEWSLLGNHTYIHPERMT